MLRFVILEHDWPTRHWDLLLESGGVLRAWRLDARPVDSRSGIAERNFDHRLVYLDYEGPVSGNRGTVQRCDSGVLEWLVDREDEIVVRLRSTAWDGSLQLRLRSGRSWTWEFTPGEVSSLIGPRKFPGA
jgi:hypothetical protein